MAEQAVHEGPTALDEEQIFVPSQQGPNLVALHHHLDAWEVPLFDSILLILRSAICSFQLLLYILYVCNGPLPSLFLY